MFKKKLLTVIMSLFVLGCIGSQINETKEPEVSKTIVVRNIEIELPKGMRDITETKNVTFAPFSKFIARLLFVFSKNEYYLLSFVKDVNGIRPFILMSNINNKDRWFYYENKTPREITRSEAEDILYERLISEKTIKI